VAAQARLDEISGVRGTYYCGAYWRYGFHEDGVLSGERALARIASEAGHAQRALHRLG
jgi:predicted NAD/FAD-binding protein